MPQLVVRMFCGSLIFSYFISYILMKRSSDPIFSAVSRASEILKLILYVKNTKSIFWLSFFNLLFKSNSWSHSDNPKIKQPSVFTELSNNQDFVLWRIWAWTIFVFCLHSNILFSSFYSVKCWILLCKMVRYYFMSICVGNRLCLLKLKIWIPIPTGTGCNTASALLPSAAVFYATFTVLLTGMMRSSPLQHTSF